MDREQIAKAYFSQLGWTEPLPGSIIAMPFQKGYQNNYAGDTGAQAAGKILEPQATPSPATTTLRTARLLASP